MDKFYTHRSGEDLERSGIKTVVISGTGANGALLHTATGAAMRGLKVIVPVDLMSADSMRSSNGMAPGQCPGTRRQTTLTRSDLIEWKK